MKRIIRKMARACVVRAERIIADELAFFRARYGKDGWRRARAKAGSPVAIMEIAVFLLMVFPPCALFYLVRKAIKLVHRPIPKSTTPNVVFPDGLDLTPVCGQSMSALLCNYNHGQYIERAIRSVVTQSRPPDEYLILDDGSTDNSLEIISRYASQFPFIKVVIKGKNEGYIKGMKHLTAMATGDWIHRGASDDYMRPGFIENAMRLAERWPDAGAISGMLLWGLEDNEADCLVGLPGFETGYVAAQEYLTNYLEVNNPVSTLVAATLFRLKAVKEAGGWREELGIWEPSFVLQACALKYGMCYLKMPCYSWFYRRKGWTHSDNKQWEKSVGICRNYYRLMRSPEFRDRFGAKFPKLWLEANARHFLRSAFDDVMDQILTENGDHDEPSRGSAACGCR